MFFVGLESHYREGDVMVAKIMVVCLFVTHRGWEPGEDEVFVWQEKLWYGW